MVWCDTPHEIERGPFRASFTLVTGLALLAVSACGAGEEVRGEPALETQSVLINAEADPIGQVILAQDAGELVVRVIAEGLPPGEHGMHIHDQGLCEPPSFQSGGSHINPAGNDHGLDEPHGGHAGDLRNLVVAADGTADQTQRTTRMTLQPGEPHSVLSGNGSSLMIHVNPDDYTAEANTATRIACAAITP